MLIVASVTALIATIVGLLIGAWDLNPVGAILIVLGGVVVVATWLAASGSGKGFPLPALALAAAATAAALSLLALVEMLGDFDDLDDTGGIVGLALAIIATGAFLAALWGTVRRDADWRATASGADQGTRIAWLGVGLVLLAWIWHLTIGFWSFAPAALGIGAIVLAGALLFVRDKLGLPFPAAWISAILGLYAAIVALNQWNELQELGATQLELGIDDFIPFFIYVIGILLLIAGAALTAVGGPGALRERMGSGTGTGAGAS
jgi:hypothetical protein